MADEVNEPPAEHPADRLRQLARLAARDLHRRLVHTGLIHQQPFERCTHVDCVLVRDPYVDGMRVGLRLGQRLERTANLAVALDLDAIEASIMEDIAKLREILDKAKQNADRPPAGIEDDGA